MAETAAGEAECVTGPASAALCVRHGAGAGILDAGQWGHAVVPGLVNDVVTVVHVAVCQGPDDSDVGCGIEREDAVVVLEQHNGLDVRGRMDVFRCLIHGHCEVWVLEQAHREFSPQQPRDSRADGALRQLGRRDELGIFW